MINLVYTHLGFLDEYFAILVFFGVSLAISVIVFGLSLLVATQKPYTEKISAYECGFNPFDDARGTFDVRFYLVSILFIIFDLEITFLFPWALCLTQMENFFGFWSMMFFLIILTVGFIYEWKKGALEWE